MSTNLKVEELTRGVKGVQDAKSSLEHRLNDRRCKRKEAEKVLEAVNAKFSQVKYLHSKMLETVKVAQHKVSLTQAQCDRNDEEQRVKKKTLQKLEDQSKQGVQARTDDIRKFEDELSKLSAFLISAKELYTDAKLTESLANSNNNALMAQMELQQLQDEETVLYNSLASLDISSAENKAKVMDQDSIWDQIKAEEKAALDFLMTLNDEIATLANPVPSNS